MTSKEALEELVYYASDDVSISSYMKDLGGIVLKDLEILKLLKKYLTLFDIQEIYIGSKEDRAILEEWIEG